MEREFRRVGLKDVESDPRGNVLGWRPGASPRVLVVAAHLDTVFPAGTDVKVKRTGARLNGPGLVDDARGLAVLLALVEALDHAGIATGKSLLFVADVCEEGLGDLLGIKYLLREGRFKDRVDAFISLDGSESSKITSHALASKRYRITVRGPGGHSYWNFGRANPAHALGRIIARFADTEVPAQPRTTYNVGKMGGGTSVNSIPFESWMEVDIRSESDAELDKLEARLLEAARQGVEQENRQRAASGTRVEADCKLVGVRYGGTTPEESPLVQAAIWAARTMGLRPELRTGSTDSNVPISMGIPAVTMAGGGRGGNVHSPQEWFEPEGAWKGAQQALLTILSYDARTP
jgi:acetylornithine deacetylase/succinyl-diaminopimelate desuccinylase-like protein